LESKWKNYHIITFHGQSLSKNRETVDLSRDRLILDLEVLTGKFWRSSFKWQTNILSKLLIRHENAANVRKGASVSWSFKDVVGVETIYGAHDRMINEYEAFGGMRIGGGNRSTRKKPAPMPPCPPQILYDLTWDRIWSAAVGSRLLTARGKLYSVNSDKYFR
jgi:hypothetical protein